MKMVGRKGAPLPRAPINQVTGRPQRPFQPNEIWQEWRPRDEKRFSIKAWLGRSAAIGLVAATSVVALNYLINDPEAHCNGVIEPHMVSGGQTLSDLANISNGLDGDYNNSDNRAIIPIIKKLNNMTSDVIFAGEIIQIPEC